MTEIFENIKKLYEFEQPCEELSPYIEFFSETSLAATQSHVASEEFTVKLFPSYTPTIWINLGSPYFLKNGNDWKSVDQQTDVLVLRNEIIERRNLPTDNIFTIKFFPGAIEALFGISQAQIGSQILQAAELIPYATLQKLKNLSDFKDRIKLLEDFFLAKLYQKNKVGHYYSHVQKAIALFADSGLANKNSELAQQLALTDKSLYRYFTQTVGASPKTYMAMLRARTALTAYIADTPNFNPYLYGYYDRSHFYKDVYNFTGQRLGRRLN
ncbi:helix-turn-helix domain-containing protein [Pedobacter sp. KR3-3]|uniref:Helix-turn-helix domain-containing protein n=1 Tax=Pedobacter albus TaxID=3113905 RepID=A0ABU7I3K5_9SPHI|nr:helix-turn-helix domain-containing protein [Pedobacter sp. KR3-3]MEE1943987.1 helix-turn-helix domain-containing protein [Pedobacter sp. KR3-3]